MKRFVLIAGLAALSSQGCTRLGPVPGVTGASVVPQQGADVELQGAIVPGYYLSRTTQEDFEGSAVGQVSGFVEPNELIGVEGLGAGARYVGGDDADGYFEPMLRYRRYVLDDRLALGAVGHFAHASGSENGASYEMTRYGGELGGDLRLTPSYWAELHLQAGFGLSQLDASGDFCTNPNGWGRDCDDGELADSHARRARPLPTFFTGASIDLARHLDVFLHDVRLGGWLAGGWAPTVHLGYDDPARFWHSFGLGLSVGFGQASPAEPPRG